MTRRLGRHPLTLVVGALAALLWLAGCGATPAPSHSPAPSRQVTACEALNPQSHVTVDANSSFRFSPKTVCLKAGGTVTWINTTTTLDHTSTDEPGLAANPGDAEIPPGGHGWNLRLPSGRSARLTLRTVGVYRYFCIPHETLGMLGVIVVVPS